jgi:hypothetical protein
VRPDPLVVVALHAAEYEALMTRNTYLMTLQYSLLPAGILFVSLGVPLWSGNYDHNRLLIWSVYTVLLIVAIIWTDALWELYNNVLYLEQELKPTVRRATEATEFWMYERYQARVRGTGAMLWEYALPALATALYFLAICLTWPFDSKWPFPWWQYVACVLNAFVNRHLLLRSRDAVRLRKEFSRPQPDGII